MKAVVYSEYGSPENLRLVEIEQPTPKDDEVLVSVHAASVNAADWHCLRGKPFMIRLMNGLSRPRQKARILGDDMAGRVESVGKKVKLFHPGDLVFGASVFGAFAEYVCVKEKYLAIKPAHVSFEAAATLPIAAITALQALRDKGQIQSGQRILINGASGGVGMFGVQIAKLFGAEVTGVCSTRKMEMVHAIGADHVIDYREEDFTRKGQTYDLIFAVGGNLKVADYRRVLNPRGSYVCAGGSMAQYMQALILGSLISMMGKQNIGVVFPLPNQKDFAWLIERCAAGEIVPVIDKRYPLKEVPQAIRYIEEGQVHGKLIINLELKS